MSKLFINVLKRCLPVVFIFLFIFEFQRSFSLFPKIYITIEVGSIQDKLTQGVSIYDVLGSWNTLAYFTVLSNLFFVLVFFCGWTLKLKIPSWIILASFVYMFITFLVFWTSIAPFLPWGQNSYYDFINVHEHLIVFLMCALFYFNSKITKLPLLKTYCLVMIFPICYLLFTTILYAATTAAVYPFLNYGDYFSLHMPLGVSIFVTLLTIGAIAVLFFIYCYVLCDLSKFKKMKIIIANFFSNH